SQLLEELAAPNSTRRRLAVEAALLDDNVSSETAAAVFGDPNQLETTRQSCLEILFRRECFEATHSRPLPASTEHPHLLVRQLNLACELPDAQRIAFAALVRERLPYQLPQANRAACRLLGLAGEVNSISLLADF